MWDPCSNSNKNFWTATEKHFLINFYWSRVAFPGAGHGNPLQYSCLENPMDRGAWIQSMGPQRVGHNWSRSAHMHSCFTMLCFYWQFLLHSKVKSYTYTYILSFWDFLPIEVTTENQVEFALLYRKFSFVIYFIHSINRVYMSTPISQFLPPPCSPFNIHTSVSAWQISPIPFF